MRRDRGKEAGLSSPAPSPPNRTCGSPASGSPVDGFTSERTDRSRRQAQAGRWPHRRSRCKPCIPFGTVSMKPNSAGAPYRVTCARCASTRLAEIGTEVVGRARKVVTSSISLGPFAPPALPGFDARMGPLTPAWSALHTGRFPVGNPAYEHRSGRHAGLPASRRRTFQPFRLQPPLVVPGSICLRPGLTAFYLVHPVCRERTASWTSPFASRLATTTGRIEFVILRTSRSPPVALHPASRRRSYLPLWGPDQPQRGLPPRRFNALTGALAGQRSACLLARIIHRKCCGTTAGGRGKRG